MKTSRSVVAAALVLALGSVSGVAVGQPHLSNVLIREKKPYDPLKDFTAISLVAKTHNVVVLGKGVQVRNIPELIALAKASPGKLNYGSARVGLPEGIADGECR